MDQPIAVRLHIYNRADGREITGQDELSYLFLSITLSQEGHQRPGMTRDFVESLAPLNEGATSPGRGVSNVSTSTLSSNQQLGSFAHFSRLVIVNPGRYKPTVSLLKLSSSGHSDPASGGHVLATMAFNEVIVAQAGP